MDTQPGPMLNLDVIDDKIQFRLVLPYGASPRLPSPARLDTILALSDECESRASDLFSDAEESDQKLHALKESLRNLVLKCLPKRVQEDLRGCSDSLRLDYTDDRLRGVPWEAMLSVLCEETGDLLVARGFLEIPRGRSMSIDAHQLPIRVTFVLNPTADPKLDSGVHLLERVRRKEKQKAKDRGGLSWACFDTGDSSGAITRARFLKLLRKCHILVFYGHGDERGLQLSDGFLAEADIDDEPLLEDESFPRMVVCLCCKVAFLTHAFGKKGVRFFFGSPWRIAGLGESITFVEEFIPRLLDTVFEGRSVASLLRDTRKALQPRHNLMMLDSMFKVGALDSPFFRDPEVERHVEQTKCGDLQSIQWLLRNVPGHPRLPDWVIQVLTTDRIAGIQQRELMLLLDECGLPPEPLDPILRRQLQISSSWELCDVIVHYIVRCGNDRTREGLHELGSDTNTSAQVRDLIQGALGETGEPLEPQSISHDNVLNRMLEAWDRTGGTPLATKALDQYFRTQNGEDALLLLITDRKLPHSALATRYVKGKAVELTEVLRKKLQSGPESSSLMCALLDTELADVVLGVALRLLRDARLNEDLVMHALLVLGRVATQSQYRAVAEEAILSVSRNHALPPYIRHAADDQMSFLADGGERTSK